MKLTSGPVTRILRMPPRRQQQPAERPSVDEICLWLRIAPEFERVEIAEFLSRLIDEQENENA
jgi:hypothetical protein